MKPHLIKSLQVIVLSFFIGTSNANSIVENARTSLKYLVENTIDNQTNAAFDITSSENAIVNLANLLEHNLLSQSDEALVKSIRAQSLLSINLFRLENQDSIDIEQAELALSDITFAIENSPDTKAKNYLFDAGHISMHLLENSSEAYLFWEKCALLNHAACMNILANNYFTGKNGIPIDISKSINWHKRVFQTGISYSCAGAFSAGKLAELTYHFPDLNTGDSWQYWFEKRNELYNILSKEFNENDPCFAATSYVREYVLNFDSEIKSVDVIELAIELSSDLNQKHILVAIRDNKFTSQTINYLDQIKYKPDQCSVALSLLLFLKYDNQYKNFKAVQNYMTSLSTSECEWSFSLIHKLQTKGTW